MSICCEKMKLTLILPTDWLVLDVNKVQTFVTAKYYHEDDDADVDSTCNGSTCDDSTCNYCTFNYGIAGLILVSII